MMKKLLFSLFLSILVLSVTLTGFMAEEKLVWNKEWPTKIRIGAASIGGGFYMGASSMANALKEEFPELEIVVEQTKASVHNIKLIEANEVEFAMCTSNNVYDAWIGEGAYEGIEYKGVRVLMPTWPASIEFITLKKSGITDITQFTRRFSGGPQGSENNVLTHKVFELFEIKAQIVNLALTDTTLSLKTGTLEGYLTAFPNTATAELSMTDDIRVVGLTKEQGEKFIEKYPSYVYPSIIPGGSYKGNDEPVATIGNIQILIARDDLPEDMVYTVLKAVYKHQAIVEETWPRYGQSMKDLSIVKLLTSPFHKGSIKYYKEMGIELSEVATSLDE